ARATTEIGADHEKAGVAIAVPVQHEIGVALARAEAEQIEGAFAEPAAIDAFQEHLWHDHVGIDIGRRHRRGRARDAMEWRQEKSPPIRSRTAVMRPVIGAAATIAGLIRCVRAPGPWRPSKLRLVEEAERWPGARISSFMARHIEQPDCRHSTPAS